MKSREILNKLKDGVVFSNKNYIYYFDGEFFIKETIIGFKIVQVAFLEQEYSYFLMQMKLEKAKEIK